MNVSLFDYNTYKQECGKKNLGQVIVGRKLDRVEEEWYNRYYCTADGWVDITYLSRSFMGKGVKHLKCKRKLKQTKCHHKYPLWWRFFIIGIYEK